MQNSKDEYEEHMNSWHLGTLICGLSYSVYTVYKSQYHFILSALFILYSTTWLICLNLSTVLAILFARNHRLVISQLSQSILKICYQGSNKFILYSTKNTCHRWTLFLSVTKAFTNASLERLELLIFTER